MASSLTCRVHPVVLFTIADSYERRSAKKGSQDKAIGVLLGTYERGIVNVTNAFAAPFSEVDNNPALEMSYIEQMHEMLLRTSPTEMPVGWYSTNPVLTENYIAYHDYFLRFVEKSHRTKEPQPVVLLTVDTAMTTGRMNIKAYLKTTLGIPGKPSPHCAIFNPIHVVTQAHHAEDVALNAIESGIFDHRREVRLTGGVHHLHESVKQMLTWLADIKVYVADVIAGKREPDVTVGRQLMKLVSNTSQIPSKQFEQLVNNGMRDHLMVCYLAQLAQTQLSLYENMLATAK